MGHDMLPFTISMIEIGHLKSQHYYIITPCIIPLYIIPLYVIHYTLYIIRYTSYIIQ